MSSTGRLIANGPKINRSDDAKITRPPDDTAADAA
jgi:hypothetical protein